MKKPYLLKKRTYLNCVDVEGLAVIKNTEGTICNLKFITNVQINTTNSETSITYKVNAFERYMKDYELFSYKDYSQAIAKYNELAIKWNAYRDQE